MSEELKERVDSKADTEPVENKDDEDSSDSDSFSYSGSSSTDELQASSAAEDSDKCAELGGEFTKIEEAHLKKSPSVVKQHNQIRRWEENEGAKLSGKFDTNNSGKRTQDTEAATSPISFAESNTTEGSGLSVHRTENEDDEKNPIVMPFKQRDKAKSVLISYKFNLGGDDDDLDEPDIKVGAIKRAVTEAARPRKTIETKKVKKIKSNQNVYINKYMLQERIGRGSSGTVRKCKDITTGQTLAMKILNKVNLSAQLRFERTEDNAIRRSSALDDVWDEIAIMKKLSHKNIVNLVEVLDSEKMVYLVLEYLPDGSIAHSSPRIKKIGDTHQNKFRKYVRDMVEGLSYLHSQRICHSDIKPENILIGNDDILKLADFGLSKFLIQGQSRCVFDKKEGTPAFQAPECLNDSDDYKFSLFPTDIWALGVTIYQLKYGVLPFFSRNDEELTKKIKEDPIELPKDEDENLVDLLRKMLAKDPKKRITVEQLCSHPWITNNGMLSELQSNFEILRVTADQRSQAIGKAVDLNERDPETSPEPQIRNRRHTTVAEKQSKRLIEIPRNQKLDTNKVTDLANTEEGNEEDEKDKVGNDEKVTLKPSFLKRIKSAPQRAQRALKFRRQGSKKKLQASAKVQAAAITSINKDVNFSQNKQKNDKLSSKKKKRVTFSPPLPRKGSKSTWRGTDSLGLDEVKEDGERSPYLNSSNKKPKRVTFSTITFDPNSPTERTGKLSPLEETS